MLRVLITKKVLKKSKEGRRKLFEVMDMLIEIVW